MNNLDFIYEATFNKCEALNIKMEEKFIDEVFSYYELKQYSINELEKEISSEILQISLNAVEWWYQEKKKELYENSSKIVETYMDQRGAYNYEIIKKYPLTKKSTIFEIIEISPGGEKTAPYNLIQIKNKLFTLSGEQVN